MMSGRFRCSFCCSRFPPLIPFQLPLVWILSLDFERFEPVCPLTCTITALILAFDPFQSLFERAPPTTLYTGSN